MPIAIPEPHLSDSVAYRIFMVAWIWWWVTLLLHSLFGLYRAHRELRQLRRQVERLDAEIARMTSELSQPGGGR